MFKLNQKASGLIRTVHAGQGISITDKDGNKVEVILMQSKVFNVKLLTRGSKAFKFEFVEYPFKKEHPSYDPEYQD